jgi:hypothetical protein
VTDYIALQPIDHGGARAYAAGDPVPAANVEALGYSDEQVAERGSDAGQARLRELGMIPGGPDTVPEGADDVPVFETEADLDAWLEEHPDQAPAVLADKATVVHMTRWLNDHPEQVDAVLAAERAGKARAGVLHGPHGTAPDVAES